MSEVNIQPVSHFSTPGLLIAGVTAAASMAATAACLIFGMQALGITSSMRYLYQTVPVLLLGGGVFASLAFLSRKAKHDETLDVSETVEFLDVSETKSKHDETLDLSETVKFLKKMDPTLREEGLKKIDEEGIDLSLISSPVPE